MANVRGGRKVADEVRRGRCVECDDEWDDHDEIVICPECHSLDVIEVERDGDKTDIEIYGAGAR